MKTRKPLPLNSEHIIPTIDDLRDAIEAYQYGPWTKKSPTLPGLAQSMGLTLDEFKGMAERAPEYARAVQLAIEWDEAYHAEKGCSKARNPLPEWQYMKAYHAKSGMGGDQQEIRITIDNTSRKLGAAKSGNSQGNKPKVIRRKGVEKDG